MFSLNDLQIGHLPQDSSAHLSPRVGYYLDESCTRQKNTLLGRLLGRHKGGKEWRLGNRMSRGQIDHIAPFEV